MQGQLPRYTVATAYYGKEPKTTRNMDFAKKLLINLLFPDVELKHRERINDTQLSKDLAPMTPMHCLLIACRFCTQKN
jgi:hypothetical protein